MDSSEDMKVVVAFFQKRPHLLQSSNDSEVQFLESIIIKHVNAAIPTSNHPKAPAADFSNTTSSSTTSSSATISTASLVPATDHLRSTKRLPDPFTAGPDDRLTYEELCKAFIYQKRDVRHLKAALANAQITIAELQARLLSILRATRIPSPAASTRSARFSRFFFSSAPARVSEKEKEGLSALARFNLEYEEAEGELAVLRGRGSPVGGKFSAKGMAVRGTEDRASSSLSSLSSPPQWDGL